MNLTAHPLFVAAELAWKRESLGGANLATSRHTKSRRPRRGLHLPGRVRRTRPAFGHQARHA